jgi:hypothetical protein
VSIYFEFEEQKLLRVEAAIEVEVGEVLSRFVGMANDGQVRAQVLATVCAAIDRICEREQLHGVPVFACFLSRRGYLESKQPEFSVSVPRYRHDCRECKFLGTYEKDVFESDGREEDDQLVDLYTCNAVGYRTLIARYSSDGPDYTSCPQGHLSPISKKTSPELWECDRRAREEGLT